MMRLHGNSRDRSSFASMIDDALVFPARLCDYSMMILGA